MLTEYVRAIREILARLYHIECDESVLQNDVETHAGSILIVVKPMIGASFRFPQNDYEPSVDVPWLKYEGLVKMLSLQS